jgi:hypothetical protein
MNITPAPQSSEEAAPASPDENEVTVDPAVRRQFAHLYAPVSGERFPMPPLLLPSPASAKQPATGLRVIRGCPRRRKCRVADGGRTPWPRFGTARLCRS